MRRLLPALLFLLPCVVEAQTTASYTYIDQKAPAKNAGGRTPWLTATSLPKLGTTFWVIVVASYPVGSGYYHYYLATGVRNPNADLRGIGFSGYLFTSAEFVANTFYSAPGYFRYMGFRVPSNSALIGSHFYQQVVSQDGALSRGGHGVIGK